MGYKRYFIRSYGDSSIRLREPLNVEFQDCKISIRECYQSPLHDFYPELRWEYLVDTVAIGPITAINKAHAYISILADILVILEGAAVGDPIALFAIDIESDTKDREFAQPIYVEFQALRSLRRFEPSKLNNFFDSKISSLDDKVRRRINRSLHLFRRSFLEDDPIDQFEDLWESLEALNPLIRNKYDVHRQYQLKWSECGELISCSKCESEITEIDNSSGIRHVIVELLSKETEWSTIRKTRVSIVHSTEDRFNISTGLGEMISTMREGVFAALYDLLEYSEDVWFENAKYPLPLSTAPKFMMKGVIHNVPNSKFTSDLEKTPRFRLLVPEPIQVSSGSPDMGRMEFIPVDFDGPINYQFNLNVSIQKGPQDDGVDDISIEQIPNGDMS